MVTVTGKILNVGTLQQKQSMSGGQYQICTFQVTQGQTQYGVDMNNQPLMREEAWKFDALNENAQIVAQMQPGTPVSVDIMGDTHTQYGNRLRVLAVRMESTVGTTPTYGQQAAPPQYGQQPQYGNPAYPGNPQFNGQYPQ